MGNDDDTTNGTDTSGDGNKPSRLDKLQDAWALLHRREDEARVKLAEIEVAIRTCQCCGKPAPKTRAYRGGVDATLCNLCSTALDKAVTESETWGVFLRLVKKEDLLRGSMAGRSQDDVSYMASELATEDVEVHQALREIVIEALVERKADCEACDG